METKIGTWYAQPIEELEREELLKVIKFLTDQAEKQRKDIDMMGDDYYQLYAEKKLGLK